LVPIDHAHALLTLPILSCFSVTQGAMFNSREASTKLSGILSQLAVTL
jgi:hypothetical protein